MDKSGSALRRHSPARPWRSAKSVTLMGGARSWPTVSRRYLSFLIVLLVSRSKKFGTRVVRQCASNQCTGCQEQIPPTTGSGDLLIYSAPYQMCTWDQTIFCPPARCPVPPVPAMYSIIIPGNSWLPTQGCPPEGRWPTIKKRLGATADIETCLAL